MPGDSGATVVTNARAFYTTRAAAGASGTRHSPLPPWGSATPSKGGPFMHNSGALRRESGDLCLVVIARSGAAKPTILTLLLHGLLRSARNDGLQNIIPPRPSKRLAQKFRTFQS